MSETENEGPRPSLPDPLTGEEPVRTGYLSTGDTADADAAVDTGDAEGDGHLDAEGVEVPGEDDPLLKTDQLGIPTGGVHEETGDADSVVGDDHPVAHVVDLEVDQTMSMCGEEIPGDLLEDRTLAYTCAACQVAMTQRYNALADALLDTQLRLKVITHTAFGGSRVGKVRPLSTEWTRSVREITADAQDTILDQLDSGPVD